LYGKAASGIVHDLGQSLPSNLLGQSRVEDELSEIFFIEQLLKVPSEGATFHREVAPPVIEGTIVFNSRSLWVLR